MKNKTITFSTILVLISTFCVFLTMIITVSNKVARSRTAAFTGLFLLDIVVIPGIYISNATEMNIEKVEYGIAEESDRGGEATIQEEAPAAYSADHPVSIGKKGIILIKAFEGFRKRAYKAVPSEQYYTIGWGPCGPDVLEDMEITREEGNRIFLEDIKKYENYVNTFLDTYNISLTQNQYDALVSFTYNLGNVWITQDSFLLKTYLINGITNYTPDEIRTSFTNWNKAGGKILDGLTRRRNAEADLFLAENLTTDDPDTVDYKSLLLMIKSFFTDID